MQKIPIQQFIRFRVQQVGEYSEKRNTSTNTVEQNFSPSAKILTNDIWDFFPSNEKQIKRNKAGHKVVNSPDKNLKPFAQKAAGRLMI